MIRNIIVSVLLIQCSLQAVLAGPWFERYHEYAKSEHCNMTFFLARLHHTCSQNPDVRTKALVINALQRASNSCWKHFVANNDAEWRQRQLMSECEAAKKSKK